MESIFEAYDGSTALEYFKAWEENKRLHGDKFPPLVLFLDINMPRVDGFGFLEKFKELRTHAEARAIVVMMFTSSGQPEDKEKAFKYPFVKDFIVKGKSNSEVLKEKILSIISTSSGQEKVVGSQAG